MTEQTKSANLPQPKRQESALPSRAETPAPSPRAPAGRILRLQRTIGNQAVQRLIQTGRLQRRGFAPRWGPSPWTSASGAVQREGEDEEKGEKEDYDFYRDVASQIIRIAQERGITFEQAALVVAHAIAEQGVRDPSKLQFRIFNMMPTWNEMQKLKKGQKGVLQAGVRLEWLTSPEDMGGGVYKDVKSPFLVYDDLETAINHYFDRMDTYYKQASEALKQPDTPVHEFARRLKAGGYATETEYAKKVVKAYKVAARGIDGWLAGRIREDQAAIASKSWPELNKAWKELNFWKDKVRAETEPVAKAAAQEMVNFLEDAISRMEAALKKREEQVKKLKATRQRFAARAGL
jgi:hypothetical protein